MKRKFRIILLLIGISLVCFVYNAIVPKTLDLKKVNNDLMLLNENGYGIKIVNYAFSKENYYLKDTPILSALFLEDKGKIAASSGESVIEYDIENNSVRTILKEAYVEFWDAKDDKIILRDKRGILDVKTGIIELEGLPSCSLKGCFWHNNSENIMCLEIDGYDYTAPIYKNYQYSIKNSEYATLKTKSIINISNDEKYIAEINSDVLFIKDHVSIKNIEENKTYKSISGDDIKYCKFSSDNKYVAVCRYKEKTKKYEIVIWDFVNNYKKTISKTDSIIYCDWR